MHNIAPFGALFCSPTLVFPHIVAGISNNFHNKDNNTNNIIMAEEKILLFLDKMLTFEIT